MTRKFIYRLLSVTMAFVLILAIAPALELPAYADTCVVMSVRASTSGTTGNEPTSDDTNERESDKPQSQVKAVTVSAGDIAIDVTNFPDTNFRALIRQSFDADSNGLLSPGEIANVSSITVINKSIFDLTGIEYFTALTQLSCPSNGLTTLDISQNTALTWLYCYGNQLTTLDVSHNTALTYLSCSENQLTSLDISQNTALTQLECDRNQLTTLDVTQNAALKILYCGSNQLTTLDVSENIILEELGCSYNQLTELDVSQNTALTQLFCSYNQLTELDVSQNTALDQFYCNNNKLNELDVSDKVYLYSLYCYDNELTNLDITNNSELRLLFCQNNKLSSLDVRDSIDLVTLYCHDNDLTTLLIEDTYILYCGNNLLTQININTADSLGYLNCENNKLQSININNNTQLKELRCSGNSLTQLDLSNCIVIDYVDCSNNKLSILDISKNYTLRGLNCSYNNLTQLNLVDIQLIESLGRDGAGIAALDCSNNYLTSLDVRKTSLIILHCQYNYFSSQAAIIGLAESSIWDLRFSPQGTREISIEDTLDNILNDAKNGSATAVDILDALKDMDTSGLENAMQDKDILDKVKELEDLYKQTTNITVKTEIEPNTHGDFKQYADKISVIGAAFNAQQGQTISLHFSKPANDVIIDGTKFQANSAIQIEINLVGVIDSSQLDVPIVITVPIPSSISPDSFKILHYHNDGSIEIITPTINGDGTCSFIVTSFSVFAFANEVSSNGVVNNNRLDRSKNSKRNDSTYMPVSPASATSSNVSADGSVNGDKISKEFEQSLNVSNDSTITLKIRNAKTISASTLKTLAALAKKSGKTVIIHADTISENGNIQGRLYIDVLKAATINADMRLGIFVDEDTPINIKALFEKHFENEVSVISLSQDGSSEFPIQIAVKTDVARNNKKLVFYSYDPKKNAYTLLNTDYFIDSNGYIHFSSEIGGYIIISDKSLYRK